MSALLFFALFWVGVYAGDAVGIGGHDGWVTEETYWRFQFGDLEPWLYKATEMAAFIALPVGFLGSTVSFVALVVFLVRDARR